MNEMNEHVEQDVAKMPVASRIVGIFASPSEVFENVKLHPVIMVPLLCAILIGLITAPFGAQMTAVTNQELSHISIERYGFDVFGFAALVDEYGDSPMDSFVDIMGMVGFVISAFFKPLLTAAIAALGLFVLSKIARGKAKIGQLFSMYLHIYVVAAVGALISTLLMMTSGNFLDLTSLAAVLMPHGRIDMVSFNILSAISIFSIWVAVLTFIGLKILNEFSSVKAGIITAIAFLANVAVYTVMLMFTWWMMDFMVGMGLV